MSAIVTARIIRRILADNPDQSPASEAGDSAETINALREADDAQGARKVFEALAKADPGLIPLVAVMGEQERKIHWTVDELHDHEFPPLRWTVPNMVPEGLSILAGRPKLGKSWLAGQMASAVATGGLGREMSKGKGALLGIRGFTSTAERADSFTAL